LTFVAVQRIEHTTLPSTCDAAPLVADKREKRHVPASL
jgi:hypothetical protein